MRCQVKDLTSRLKGGFSLSDSLSAGIGALLSEPQRISAVL